MNFLHFTFLLSELPLRLHFSFALALLDGFVNIIQELLVTDDVGLSIAVLDRQQRPLVALENLPLLTRTHLAMLMVDVFEDVVPLSTEQVIAIYDGASYHQLSMAFLHFVLVYLFLERLSRLQEASGL